MEIKNLLTPQARQSLETASQGIKNKLKPVTDIGSELINQNVEAIQPAVTQIKDTVNTGFVEPIMKPIKRNEKIGKVNKFLASKGITVDDIKNLAEADGSDPEEALQFFRDNGIQIEGMEELQAQKQGEVNQGEDLGFFGGAKELATGAFRAGEQIPRIAGAGLDFVTQNVTGPLISGGLDLVGADQLAGRWREGAKTFGEGAKQVGEDITRAGEGDITEKQRSMRRLGGELALTAPIGGEFLAGAKSTLGLAGRSGVVGAGFGATQPIIDKGGEATMGDIATGGAIGGVTGAVAGPLIGKVIAPAIGGIASKTGKYGQALIKGGVEGAKKSIARDINALKTPGVETITRNIPKAVVRRDLGFTPTERAKIEKITGQDEGTYILSKGLAGKGKEELAEVFMKQSDDMYNGITKNLSKVDARVQSPVAKEALLDILEQLESSPKIARAYAKDIEGVKSMLSRNEFTLSELNNIRRAYDKVNTGMFTVQGKARSGLENAIDVKVRQDLSKQLQKEAKKYGVDVKAMNTELRAGLEIKDALLRRLSQEERNNFIGLQDLGVSAILSGGEPLSAVATIVAKKYAEKVAPGLAQKAYNLNKAPNVTRNVSRGNTITPRNKSSKLGLADNTSDTVVSDGVKPKVKTVIPKDTGIKPNNPTTAIKEKKPVNVPKKTVNAPIVEKNGSVELVENSQQWADRLTFKNGERKYDYYTLVKGYTDVLKKGKESGYYKNADDYIKKEMDKLITTPSNAKSKVSDTPTVKSPTQTTTVPTRKIIGLTDPIANAYKGKTGGGIKNVEPGLQVKYNQGDYYEPVRMALTQKDADISSYGALESKMMKGGGFGTKEQMEQLKGIERKLGMTRDEIRNRVQELKDIAKNARSKDEEVLVDLRDAYDPKQTTTNLSKSKGGFLRLPEIGKKGIIPKDTLVEEARKYSNVEDFVGSMLYRGEKGKFRPIQIDKRTGMIKTLAYEGYSTTNDFNIAKTFGADKYSPEGEVRAFILSKDAKVLDSKIELERIAGKTLDKISIDMTDILRKAKKEGYDAIDMSKIRPYFEGVGFKKKESEVRILNPNKIKQVSGNIQNVNLTDIYNQAHKGIPRKISKK